MFNLMRHLTKQQQRQQQQQRSQNNMNNISWQLENVLHAVYCLFALQIKIQHMLFNLK